MDLVSSTLDKYLKHRFNGDIKVHLGSDAHPMSVDQPESKLNGSIAIPETSELPTQSIEIQNISFQKLRPCCVSISHDETHIAAGFENSHIYLWHLSSPNSSTSAVGHHEQAITPNYATNDSSPNSLKVETKYRLLAHSGSVYSIKFIKDNDLMLSCSEDTTIRLWSLKTKCNLSIYRGHKYPVWSIAIASKDDYFASASMDATARLWRFDKMCPLRIFCGHDDDVECLEFHPNSKYVATGSADCTVRLWSIADGRSVRLMVGHKKSIVSLSFMPNGKLLASASSDGSIKLWNLETSCVTCELPAQHLSTRASFSISPEQSFVSTYGCDNILRIWRIEAEKMTKIKEHNLKDELGEVILTSFSRSDKLFLVGHTEPTSARRSKNS